MNCESPLLIHRDGSMSCEAPGCSDGLTAADFERALARHRVRVPCDDGGARCLRCQPVPDPQDDA